MPLEYTFAGLCKGTTKAGKRCQHTVVYANGFCRQHGGDSSEFMAERIKRLIEKSRRRTARWYRKLGIKPPNGRQTPDKP